MKQMTIRAIDPELEQGIEALSKQKKWSINQVAIHLMRKGLGLTDEVVPERIGDQLASYAGSWTAKEAATFDQAVEASFGQVDEDAWK